MRRGTNRWPFFFGAHRPRRAGLPVKPDDACIADEQSPLSIPT